MTSRPPAIRVAIRVAILATVLIGAGILATVAQEADLRAIVETYRRNLGELQEYTWISNTEVSVDEQVRQITRYSTSYDPAGNVQRKSIADKSPKKRKAKKQKKKTEAFIEELKVLVGAYTELGPHRIRAVFDRSMVRQDEASGLLKVQARNVVRQGDSMDVWADGGTKRLRRFEIMTSLEGEPIFLTAEFIDLEGGGPTYPSRITVRTEMKEKKVVIKIDNGDYVRQGS